MLPKGTLEHAARIRRILIKGRDKFNQNKRPHQIQPLALDGACGLASVLLCLALGDTTLTYLKGTSAHAWNVFPFQGKELIVDITATQFREGYPFMPLESGVFLGRRPLPFHRLNYTNDESFYKGLAMFYYIENDDWYTAPRRGATLGEVRRWRSACRMVRQHIALPCSTEQYA